MAKVTMTDVVDGVAVDSSSVTVEVISGTQGPQGPQGPAGPTGATGASGPAGPAGADGADGADGEGVPVGGTTGQVLAKASATDFDTEWVDQTGGSGGTVTSDDITDATTVGKAVLTAADAATARTAIGAGTSSLALGTTSTTAKAGNYAPAAADISDATTVGKSVLTAADAASARTAIGAGTSSLALGTTSTTALAGDTAIPDSADDIGAVPTTRTVAGHALSADVTISAADVSAVPTTRTVNSKALSADITLSASDVSAVPTTRTVNSKALSADITLTASDVSAVPTTRTVAGHALSSNVTVGIDDLSDVDTSTAAPTDGQVLTWVDADSKWEPADATGGGGSSSPWSLVLDNALSSLAGFTSLSGTWAVTGGVIEQSDTTASTIRRLKYNTQVTAPTAVIVECEMKYNARSSGNGRMGIIHKFDGGNTGGGGLSYMQTTDGTAWTVNTEVDAIANLTNFGSVTYTSGDWAKLRVVVFGGTWQVFLNGTVLAGAASTATNTAIANGFVGLYTYGLDASFRNLKVWNLALPA